MIPVKGCVKNYHWGKVGDDSHVARFYYQSPSNETSDKTQNNLPLAELWFGSHPSGPASLIIGNKLVKFDEFFKKQPEMVGVIEKYLKYNKQLPFLFKILSVAQPLSLQAHPDKNLAQKLHEQDPNNYPDDNHKPELAIALTDFHVLCDFRPHNEIVNYMSRLDPLRRIVGEEKYLNYSKLVQDNISKTDIFLRSALQECFRCLMTCPREVIVRETNSLLGESSEKISKELMSLVVEFVRLYPGDPAIFAPFFLNYIKLSPGQGIFLKANKLHAYIKGECLECMACSDNVVRAGLTTKYRDVETLITMLDYVPASSINDLVLASQETLIADDECSIISYSVPTDEFNVEKITITRKNEHTLDSKSSGSFLVVLNGKAVTKDFYNLRDKHKLSFGFAGFVPPKIKLKLTDIQGTLVMYRAFC